MRSNGLTAPAYTPVADLEPQVADALLADLRVQGVAAYTKPVESSSTMGFDRPEFRTSVKDRLYVDSAAAPEVRQLIALQGADLESRNDDLTWEQIVATFDQPVSRESAGWPAQEDIDTSAQASGVDSHSLPEASTASPAEWDRWRQPAPEDRDESDDPFEVKEHFVPPPPPPLPRLDPAKQLAWLGLIGGPLLLLVAALFTIALPTWVSLLAVAGFVGGFIMLIATMDDSSDEDRDSDDGAVV